MTFAVGSRLGPYGPPALTAKSDAAFGLLLCDAVVATKSD
jgi:hypothetical protein